MAIQGENDFQKYIGYKYCNNCLSGFYWILNYFYISLITIKFFQIILLFWFVKRMIWYSKKKNYDLRLHSELHRLHALLHFLQTSSSYLLHVFEQMSQTTAHKAQTLSAYLLFLAINRTAIAQISEQSRQDWIQTAILLALLARHDVIQASQVLTQSLQVWIHLSKVRNYLLIIPRKMKYDASYKVHPFV